MYNSPPLHYDRNIYLEYFIHLKDNQKSFSLLNTNRAALSLILDIVEEDEKIIKRFFKGIYNLKPPAPKYAATWEPNIVLEYLEKLHPLNALTIEQLAQKLVTLLALTTAHRVQTLANIRIENIQISEQQVEIRITDKIKTSGCHRFQPLLIIPFFKENEKLCVASIIIHYLERTSNYRNNESKLILTYKKPFHPASCQTISRWIKTVLTMSGVDTTKFSTHSTRHASTSAAFRAGVNIETIRKTAGWSSKSETFNKFYNRPITNNPAEFARAIISNI